MVGHFQIFYLDAIINAFVKYTIPFAIGDCQVRVNFQRAIKIEISTRKIPHPLIGQAAQVMGACIVRIQPYGTVKVRNCFPGMA